MRMTLILFAYRRIFDESVVGGLQTGLVKWNGKTGHGKVLSLWSYDIYLFEPVR